MNTVALLFDKNGQVLSVWSSLDDAKKRVEKYNADPDAGAPYMACEWAVQEGNVWDNVEVDTNEGG